MPLESHCLIVEENKQQNLLMQESLRHIGVSPHPCSGLFHCEQCHKDPDIVVLGGGAVFPDTSVMGQVEVMIRETHVPVLLPEGVSEEQRMRFHNYHLYENLDQNAHLIGEIVGRHQKRRALMNKNKQMARAITLMDHAQLSFQTLSEAQALSQLFGAMGGVQNKKIQLGLCELFINAIEHGNLGISHPEKIHLRKNGQWLHEIEKRQTQPDYQDKKVQVFMKRENDRLHLSIIDEGSGFGWQNILNDSQKEIRLHTHSLGVRLAQDAGFEEFSYHGAGNEVRCSFKI